VVDLQGPCDLFSLILINMIYMWALFQDSQLFKFANISEVESNVCRAWQTLAHDCEAESHEFEDEASAMSSDGNSPGSHLRDLWSPLGQWCLEDGKVTSSRIVRALRMVHPLNVHDLYKQPLLMYKQCTF